jgi:hypothetical protein
MTPETAPATKFGRKQRGACAVISVLLLLAIIRFSDDIFSEKGVVSSFLKGEAPVTTAAEPVASANEPPLTAQAPVTAAHNATSLVAICLVSYQRDYGLSCAPCFHSCTLQPL